MECALRWAVFFLTLATTIVGACGGDNGYKELKESLFNNLNGSMCVKLLSETGEVGCSSGAKPARAPLQYAESSPSELSGRRVAVIPQSSMPDFLTSALEDARSSGRIAGVLISTASDTPASYSPAPVFPHSTLSPYAEKYSWNPEGRAFVLRRFPFPMALLGKEDSERIERAAKDNERRDFNPPHRMASLNYPMRAEKDARFCLRRKQCRPLGGYSAFATTPAWRRDESATDVYIKALVLSRIDSTALFFGQAKGASADIASFAATLVCARELSNMESPPIIGFVGFSGEPYGLMGSRQFFRRAKAGRFPDLAVEKLEAIVDLGSLGGSPSSTLWANGDSGTDNLQRRLQSAAERESMSFAMPGSNVPTPPPSSLFTARHEGIHGGSVWLGDTGETVSQGFFWSYLDSRGRVNSSYVAAAGRTVARAIYEQVVGEEIGSLRDFASSVAVVEEALDCFYSQPKFNCSYATRYFSPRESTDTRGHSIGVLQRVDSDPHDHSDKEDASKFAFYALADAVGVKTGTTREECEERKSPATVCVGPKEEGYNGTFKEANVSYVLALAPEVKEKGNGWAIKGEPVGPVWVESDWSAGVGAWDFVATGIFTDYAVLFSGVAATLLAVGVVVRDDIIKRRKKGQ